MRPGQLARGIALNWVALAVSLVVAFLLSPFVVHRLGNIGFGVWTLVNSIVAYMALLDLGLRGAVTRFVSRHHAKGDHLEASRAVSAVLWLRLWIALAILVTTPLLSSLTTTIFHIPPDMHVAARWAVIATAASLAMTLTGGVFGGVLAALCRFDLLSAVGISQTLLRALGVVWLLRSGYGIVALAVWELTVVAMANIVVITVCFRAYPDLRIFLRRPDSVLLRSLWGYSFYAFLLNVCVQLIYYTDVLVVGAFVSAGAVTFYAIGSRLIDYLRQVVSSLTMTFTPVASQLDADDRHRQLRQLLIHGTRATMLLALPIEVALFFHGHTFIGLWMGDEYAHVSGRVLQILLLDQVLSIANFTSGGIAYGLGKHRLPAVWASVVAVANLGSSILLVYWIGLEGVAWGTVISGAAVHAILWPRYVCSLLHVRLGHYLWQSWLRPGLAIIPFALACFLADRFWLPTSLLQFSLQMAALLPFLLLGMIVCFWADVSGCLRGRATGLAVLTEYFRSE